MPMRTNVRVKRMTNDHANVRLRMHYVCERTFAIVYRMLTTHMRPLWHTVYVSQTQTNGGIVANVKLYKGRASDLANELGIDAKVLRNYLRKNHTRPAEAKNTTWVIPESVANAARKAFAKNVATEAPKA